MNVDVGNGFPPSSNMNETSDGKKLGPLRPDWFVNRFVMVV